MHASKRLLYCLIAALPLTLSGGQSLVMSASTPPINVTDPPYSQDQSWRIEFQVQNWTPPPQGVLSANFFYLNGLGAIAYFYPDGSVAMQSRDPVVQQAPCFVSLTGRTNVLIRLQKNVSALTLTCEIWNFDGTGYTSSTLNINSLVAPIYTGGTVGNGVTADMGFLRVFTTTVALGSRPPVTANTGNWTELKFDGNVSDSSGNGHGGTGTATYVPTPNQSAFAYPKTSGAPSWSNWLSLRAGFPAQLDGTASFSLSDASSTVTGDWQELSGPSNVIWSGRTSITPTITGLVFGTYTFLLKVTDAAGNTATSTLQAAAVATDDNGIVVNANPAADAIFGPMIAFGQNPWGYADYRNLVMEQLQQNTYATPPSWATPPEPGTVSYSYFDPLAPPTAASLAANITASTLTIPMTNAAALDLSSLPSEILLGTQASWEIIRICSVSGNTLTACYDGRGFHYGVNNSYVKPATAWTAGASVWQAKVTGNGTHFLTTICAYGAGWPVAANVPIVSNGTVIATAGSTAIAGTGTNWSGNQTSLAIAIFATHGGAPFTFFSYVASVKGADITLARPFPPDADTGSYSYSIFNDQRNAVLHYTRTDGTNGDTYFPTAGCESNTSMYLYFGPDNQYHGQVVTASPYSYMDGYGYVGDFSTNFYDMGLAHYAFYFRSGYTPSLTAARNIEDYWIRYPENAQGDGGGQPRDKSIIGVVAAAVLDGDRASNWSGLRTFAAQGYATAVANSCLYDPRESAYQLAWLSLAAEFDPDPTQRANWQNDMATAYARDNGCRQPDNSWASGTYWNPSSAPQVVVTQGSQTATPVSGTFPSSMCGGTAWGTALATNGSASLTALTGAFVAPNGNFQIMVGGTRNGVRYDLSAQYDYNSGTSLTLSALWPGDTGTVYWMIDNNYPSFPYVATIATGTTDPNFGQVFSCSLTDSTHLFLHRPWPGISGTYDFFPYNLVGTGSQPFMIGIKALQMRYGAQVYAPYQALDAAAADWVATTGFDPLTKGIYYGRVFPVCEPALVDSGITDVLYRNPNCIENSYNPAGVAQARARNSEAQNAMTVNYLANPTAANQALGDLFYGAVFGAAGYTATGYFGDGITASNLDNGSLGSYKWPGFFFGVGMAHQWPATRLGGVAPAQYRTVSVSFNLGKAATLQIKVTAPSGAVATYQCGSVSPCNVTVDDRQGAHWYQIAYLSESGAVQSQTDPALLMVSRTRDVR